MRNALTLLLVGAGQGVLAALYPQAAWLLAWSGLGFGVVAVAYALQKPGVFGKRGDGTMAWGPCVLLLPYLLLTWLLWYCQTRFSREAVCDEVAPGLWLRRRVTGTELPPDVTLVVDLTSEFGEPRALRTGRAYLCLPTLDNAAPDLEAFAEAVRVCRSRSEGRCLGRRRLCPLRAGARTLGPVGRCCFGGARAGRQPGRGVRAGEAGAARRPAQLQPGGVSASVAVRQAEKRAARTSRRPFLRPVGGP